MIAREFRSAVKEMVTKELLSTVGESLNDFIGTSFYNTQSIIWSVIYNVVEQVVLDLLRKNVIAETIDLHIAKILDSDGAPSGFRRVC